MLFSGITFLYYFLTVTVLLYFLAPNKLKNTVLLIASLFFYFAGEPVYSIIMVASALSGYAHGLVIDKYRGGKLSKAAMISSLTVSIALLGFFKYSDFFINNVNAISRAGIKPLGLALPIGISFYTFQIISYTIDLYRGNARVQKNPLDFITYVSLFPQLIAGPIVRYADVQNELSRRGHSFADTAYGVGRFALGLGKKVIISNILAEFCAILSGIGEKTVISYWLSAIAFTLQIYFDFSGYSDMAIGLGRVFGFHFPENFNYPYISASITEFWRRWHISLGTWFRDYVYIPLGGNRVSAPRMVLNIMVVWGLTGFWHGAEWNFIIWGLYFGIILLAEKLFILRLFKKSPYGIGKAIGHIYTLFLTVIGFVIFNETSLSGIVTDLSAMFGVQGLALWNTETLYYLKSYTPTLILASFLATPAAKKIYGFIASKKAGSIALSALKPICYIAILIVCTAGIIDGSFNPFIYFRF